MKSKEIKFVIIGSTLSENSKDLEKEINLRGHKVDFLKFSDIVFEYNSKLQNFDIKKGGVSLLEFDVFIFRGYNKSFVEAQILAKWLVDNKKIVIDEFLSKKFVPSKIFEAMMFSKNKINHIQTFYGVGEKSLEKIVAEMIMPIVVKPVDAQKGQGVEKFESGAKALEFLRKNSRGYMVQKFIPADGDIRVVVVNGRALGAMKRFVGENDFRSNVSLGAKTRKVELNSNLRDISEKAAKAMNYEIAGVDVMEQKGEYVVLEVNHTPEWQGFKRVTGINPAVYIIDYAVKKYEKSKSWFF